MSLQMDGYKKKKKTFIDMFGLIKLSPREQI